MKGIYIMKRKIFVQAERFLFGDKVDKEYTDKIYNILGGSSRGHLYILATNDFNVDTLEEIRAFFDKYCIKHDTFIYTTPEDAVCQIKDELEKSDREDDVRYLVVADKEIEELTFGHTIYPSIQWDSFEEIANYSLNHAFWCESPRIDLYHTDDCKIEKVVFLDIDGVLNTDNRYEEENFVAINEKFVQNLALIVHETKASIVLSSSWRYGLEDMYDYIGKEMDPNIKLLVDTLKKYDMHIYGMTPVRFNGPNGRPFEIRAWLSDKSNLKNFVILDDETFWKWNWLKSHVVCTSETYYNDDGRCKTRCGLTYEMAKKAIEILNRNE